MVTTTLGGSPSIMVAYLMVKIQRRALVLSRGQVHNRCNVRRVTEVDTFLSVPLHKRCTTGVIPQYSRRQ